MLTLADIFQQYGEAYRAQYGQRMLPSHHRAMAAIERCRTRALGGHVHYCEECQQRHYSYHSCRNRHCPQCQYEAGEEWLVRQQALLLPGDYFMLTFTLPEEVRRLARSQQKIIYNLLFLSSAQALQELAGDPRFVGGKIGMVGVLHTWGRDLNYHPHVHYLVPGGGLAADGARWLPSKKKFLVHVKPLSILFRAKFRDGLKKAGLFLQLPASVWRKKWVVHCEAVGNGDAALKYLAPYIFRVAISNRRLVNLQDGKVTFRYRPSGSRKYQNCTLPAEEFIRRFLQHVLPKGFVKVRYYGLFSSGNRPLLKRARQLLGGPPVVPKTNDAEDVPTLPAGEESLLPLKRVFNCPHCGRPMVFLETLKAKRHRPPP